MRAAELRSIIKREPFEPVWLSLSDGRSVLIRHPDQVVISERTVFVGLAKIERSRPLATPTRGDAISRDFILLNLLHITAIEPANNRNAKPKRKRRK